MVCDEIGGVEIMVVPATSHMFFFLKSIEEHGWIGRNYLNFQPAYLSDMIYHSHLAHAEPVIQFSWFMQGFDTDQEGVAKIREARTKMAMSSNLSGYRLCISLQNHMTCTKLQRDYCQAFNSFNDEFITDPMLPDTPIIFPSNSFLELTEGRREQFWGRNCRNLLPVQAIQMRFSTGPGPPDILSRFSELSRREGKSSSSPFDGAASLKQKAAFGSLSKKNRGIRNSSV